MLDIRYSKEIEEKWQNKWIEEKIYEFDEKNEEKEIYSIDTPPPFTSGELHMGHVLSYSFFDFTARYKRMNNFNVFYPQGWDCHGFPTEIRVEKKYGKLPPTEFRQKCIEWTHKMIEKMKEQMKIMGFSPDWRYEYTTMTPEYYKKVQLSLIEMYKKGQIYRAAYPVHWCPHCVSAIAKAELEDLERESFLNYIIFSGPNNENLEIATTRPELLPACVALMFNPQDERYKHLDGKKAKTPLGDEVPIIADKDVEMEFGTGLMMRCTFGDKMDVVCAHRHNLAFKDIITPTGRMQNTGEFDNLKIEQARIKIIEKLKANGKLTKQEKKPQTIKVHDRCKTPHEFIVSMQWFADVKAKAKEIEKFAKQIQWVPGFGITYFMDWIEKIDWDWVISRQRIFGTPLPFYYCEKCKATACADKLPFYPEKAEKKICSCKAEMRAETNTADCWVDSSITPLIISGWPKKEKLNKFYPASLRPQGVEIVRTWAFYTVYRCSMLTNKAPFKTILLNGNVLAPDGKKMSKSLGNIITPDALRSEYPTDAIRQWAALSGAMAKDRPFSYEDMKYAKGFLTKLWNSARFVEASIEGYSFNKDEKHEFRLVDKWIVSGMNELIREFTVYMEKFEFHYALNKLHDFYWHDFCDNYLEYVKHRIYNPEKHGSKSKKSAQYCLCYVLYNSLLLLAPIAPHITEEIWRELFNKEKSIHKSQFPSSGPVDKEAISKAQIGNEIVKMLRQHKALNKKAMNSPVRFVKLKAQEISGLEEDIKGVMKIEKLEIEKGEKLELLNVEFE